MLSHNLTSHRSSGFTLIELLVVLVILAAVAGLVIPKLGFVEGQAGNATAAAGTSQVMSNLEIYKTTTGSYPLGLDSLLENTGTAAPTAVYTGLWEHSTSGVTFGPKQYFEMATLNAGLPPASPGQTAQSFGHAFAPVNGNYYFYDHESTSTDPANSGKNKRTFASASSAPVAFVKPLGALGTTGPNLNDFLVEIYKAAGYPDGTPTGTRLVAFGIGPNASSIGSTMISAPTHAEQDQTKYSRFIAIFAVHNNAKPAELKTVIDSQGVSVNSNVNDYRKAAPDHD